MATLLARRKRSLAPGTAPEAEEVAAEALDEPTTPEPLEAELEEIIAEHHAGEELGKAGVAPGEPVS